MNEENPHPKDEDKLDDRVLAVCACGKEEKYLTFRILKNRWPHCSCKISMKVLTNAV